MPEWVNWDGRQRCSPVAIEHPRTEQEVCDIVKRARANGQTVKAAGSGHSFTDCALTDGVLIDLVNMQSVLHTDGDLVTVEAGVRLKRLGNELASLGLGLENQGDIDYQAIAGAVSTATHGTGRAFANIGSNITSVRLVDGNGEVQTLDGGDDLLAGRASIGALGVITALTIRCVPLYTLHRRDEPLPLPGVLDNLDEHVEGNDHFELFVFPYTRTALTRSTRRSDEPPQPTPAWRRRVQEEWIENTALGVVCRTGRRIPSQVPRLNRFIASAMSTTEVCDRGHRVYATTRAVRFTEMEYAIPRAHAREAVERVLEIAEKRPVLFPLELRFAAGDDALLSTAHGRDTAYVAVHQFVGMEFEPYFREVEALMDGFGGRPHWGKRHFQTAATLRDRYPGFDRFLAVRDRLDPDRTFANDYTRRVLDAHA